MKEHNFTVDFSATITNVSTGLQPNLRPGVRVDGYWSGLRFGAIGESEAECLAKIERMIVAEFCRRAVEASSKESAA